MGKSKIVKLREAFEKSNAFNGNPDLEARLSAYISDQGAKEKLSSGQLQALEEARSMLTSIESRVSPSIRELHRS